MTEATLSPHEHRFSHFRRWRRLTGLAVLIGFSALALLAAARSAIPLAGTTHNVYGSLVGGDFVVFYSAAFTAIQGDWTLIYDSAHLYQLQNEIAGEDIQGMPFVYPPVALMLWMPFATLPYLPAFYLWVTVTVSGLYAVLSRIDKHWIVPGLIAVSPLVLRAATTGQSGNLAAVFIGAAFLLLRRHPLAAGAILGCLVYKPHLAIMVPLCLAAGRHWRAFLATTASTGFLILLSLSCFGFQAWLDCFQSAGSFATGYFDDLGNMWHRVPTVLNSVQGITGSGVVAWTAQIGVGAVAALLTIVIWRSSSDELARSLSFAAATFLASPKALLYDTAMFAIPLAYLFHAAIQGRIRTGGILLAACIWGLPIWGEVARLLTWQPTPLVFLAALGFALRRAMSEQNQRPAWSGRHA